MSAFWFSRWGKHPARPAPLATRRRARLEVEALEGQMVLNNYTIVYSL